jgi:mycothiol conjugate amidase Mca
MDSMTLMAVHAHPDDEVVTTGGVMARYFAAGARVALVCATRGEVGEILDPNLEEAEARPRLASIREEELRCACAVLGVSDLFFLDYRDSGMAGTPDNEHPGAFHRANPEEATGRLVRLIRELRPQVLVTYDEKGGYGHPDHLMAHRITVEAFEAAADPDRFPEQGLAPWQPQKLYYTAFPRSELLLFHQFLLDAGWPSPFERDDLSPDSMGTPDELVTTRIDVREHLQQKLEALRCHRTQFAADSFFFQMPEEINREGFGFEHFVRARSLVSAPVPEEDLFAGL